MISIKFYIEKRRFPEGIIKEKFPLVISISYNGNRLKVYSGRTLKIQEWDINTQTFNTIFPDSDHANRTLNKIKNEIINLYKIHSSNNTIPDSVVFKRSIKELLKIPYRDFFDTYLEFMETNNTLWKKNTYKKVKTLYKQLKEFSSAYNIKLDNIDNDCFSQLIKFYRSKNLKETTISKNMDLLQWFLNWAKRNNRIIGRDFKIEFKPRGTSTRIPVYLYWEELMKLYNLNITNHKESIVRDIFCLIAFTGIRYSEISSLLKLDVNDEFINISGYRSRRIPQNKFSSAIIEKYKNKYYRDNLQFMSFSIITFIKYLRKVASAAGLNRQVFNEGTSSISIKDVISAEIALNTYVANAIKLGISFPVIMQNAKGVSSQRQLLIKESIENSNSDQTKKFDLLFEKAQNTAPAL